MKKVISLHTSYKIFTEAKSATSDEYYEYSSKIYPHLIDFIKQGDELGKSITGSEIITLKSDSDNLIIRYIVSDTIVIILGAVTKEGKLVRGDVEDLRKWIDELVGYIEDGKTILTSPNELSEPLLHKALTEVKKRGIELDIMKHGLPIRDVNKNLNWVNYQIRRKGLNESVNVYSVEVEYSDYPIIEDVYGSGFKVYSISDKNRYDIVPTIEKAIELSNSVNFETSIIDLERYNQKVYNETIERDGGKFTISTAWKNTGTEFVDDNHFYDKKGEKLFIIHKDSPSVPGMINVEVATAKGQKVGFTSMKKDNTGNLRNYMYIFVSPIYKRRGIGSAMYDYLLKQGFTIKPSLKGLMDDGIKLWNSNYEKN